MTSNEKAFVVGCAIFVVVVPVACMMFLSYETRIIVRLCIASLALVLGVLNVIR